MDDNEDTYYMILYTPQEYIKSFKTMNDFRVACEPCSVLDLDELLNVFEEHELYEHCAVIKDVLDAKLCDND